MEKNMIGISDLMQNQKNIRNMAVIAHVDHGKSTLTNTFLIKGGFTNKEGYGGRYMDTRPDEQERGITIKCTAISLKHSIPEKILESYCNKDDYKGENFLINLIDSPGHVDFSSEVTAALRVTDGALVVIDCIEGACVQTETVLRQAIEEGVVPTLCMNKIDRALLELKYSPEELYEVFQTRVEKFNALLQMTLGERTFVKSLNPGVNDVSFCSGLQGWGFTVNKFAGYYLRAKGEHTYEKEKSFSKILFKSNLYCDFEGEFVPNYNFKKVASKAHIPKGKKSPFIQLILDPIYKAKDLCFDRKIDEITEYMKKFGICLKQLSLNDKMEGKQIFVQVFRLWLPAADCLLDQIITKLPNPVVSQKRRADYLYTGPKGDETYNGIKECSVKEDAPVVMYVSKMVPDASNGFIAFGRVLSGVVKAGIKVYVQTPDYEVGDNDGKNPNRAFKTISKCGVMMGKNFIGISSLPAGNIIGITGVEGVLKKTGTISTCSTSHNIKTMKFSVTPIVKVAVSPVKSQDLNRFKEGLNKLLKSDPLLQVTFEESGKALVACAGELHLEVALGDLKAFAKCSINVEEPQVQYYEGISYEFLTPRMSKSANKHNRITMTIEELDVEIVENMGKLVHKDPKVRAALFRDVLSIDGDWVKKIIGFYPDEEPLNILVDQTKGIQYLNEVRDHLSQGIKFATLQGPMIGEKVKGCRFNMTDITLHADAIHRSGNQIIRPAENVIRGLILEAGPILYEPVFLCTIWVPDQFANSCEVAVKNRRGSIIDSISENNVKTIQCNIPVSECFGLNKILKESSKGHAYANLVFDHFGVCPGSLDRENSIMYKTVHKIRNYKNINTKLEASSYFDTL